VGEPYILYPQMVYPRSFSKEEDLIIVKIDVNYAPFSSPKKKESSIAKRCTFN
jgi:hypothetical protein